MMCRWLVKLPAWGHNPIPRFASILVQRVSCKIPLLGFAAREACRRSSIAFVLPGNCHSAVYSVPPCVRYFFCGLCVVFTGGAETIEVHNSMHSTCQTRSFSAKLVLLRDRVSSCVPARALAISQDCRLQVPGAQIIPS